MAGILPASIGAAFLLRLHNESGAMVAHGALAATCGTKTVFILLAVAN